jgi:hypothetical protein
MADGLPPPCRPCVRCGKGTIVRARVTNPDTGEQGRVAMCLLCAAEGEGIEAEDEPGLLQERISEAFAASAGPDGKPDDWRRRVFDDGPGAS